MTEPERVRREEGSPADPAMPQPTLRRRPGTRWAPDIGFGAALLGLALLLWLPRLQGPIDLRWDGGVYYILGSALAERNGYRLLNEPAEIEAVQYPPLLPLIVAAHQKVLGTSDYLVVAPWLRVFYLLLSLVLTIAVYGLARTDLSPKEAFLAAILSALALHVYYLSDVLYTELPFALVTVLFVICNRHSDRAGLAVLSGMLAVAAYLLRTAGAGLLAAWVAESLCRRRWRQAAVRAALAALPVLLWHAHIYRVTHSSAYQQPAYNYQRASYYYSNVSYSENSLLIDPFFPELDRATNYDLAMRFARGVVNVPVSLGEALSAPAGFWQWPLRKLNEWAASDVIPLWLVFLPLVLLGVLAVVGTACWVAARDPFIPLYLGLSVILICLAPWPEQFPRYFTPLVPFLALSTVGTVKFLNAAGHAWCPDRWRKAPGTLGVLTLATLLLAQGVALVGAYTRLEPVSYYDAQGEERVHRLFFYSPPWRALDASLEWVRRHAGPDDVIATTVPHTAYVRTGLKAVLPPLEKNPDEARRLLDSVPVRYVVLDELDYPGISQRYTAPAVEGRPDLWKQVYIAGDGMARVYERWK